MIKSRKKSEVIMRIPFNDNWLFTENYVIIRQVSLIF